MNVRLTAQLSLFTLNGTGYLRRNSLPVHICRRTVLGHHGFLFSTLR